MHRYSRALGRLSQRGANGAGPFLATITFLGEQRDITDPDAAVARETTFRQWSVPIT